MEGGSEEEEKEGYSDGETSRCSRMSSGMTTVSRSGRSLRRISQHLSASSAKACASCTGQPVTLPSRRSANVPYSSASETVYASPMASLAVTICRKMTPSAYTSDLVHTSPVFWYSGSM